MRRTPEERISDLEKQRDQINARLQKERAKISAQKRKDNTRRKIIVGAAMLAHAEHDDTVKVQLWRILDQHVTRPQDRALLGLKERSEEG